MAPTKKHVDYDCVLTIAGRQYDLSSWANAHPGGATILRKYHRRDATNAFQRVGHSPEAYMLLRSFAVDPKDSSNLKDTIDIQLLPGTWRKKIFTREDPQNLHKTCGLFALLHFAYRYFQMLFGDDFAAGFGSGHGRGAGFSAVLCLIPHALLSVSSLIFHSVPKERVVGLPMIWKEFRVHSIIFALRSVVATLCGWVSIYFHHDSTIRLMAMLVCAATVILANYLADEATRKLCPSKPESTTATMPYWEGCSVSTQRRFKTWYAYCQFIATLACLSMTNPAWPFAVMLPIQLAAFLMTMVRKGFLSSKGYHVLYTWSLTMPYMVAIRRMVYTKNPDILCMFLFGWLLYKVRCTGINKYYLWVPIVVLRVAIGDKFIAYDRY